VIKRDPKVETIKLHWWYKADTLDTPPHSHPWDFKSEILVGGYKEQVWWVDSDGVVQNDIRTYKVGDFNTNTIGTYHLVISVEPGTVTKMTTGPATEGNTWGWLDVETGNHLEATLDPNFLDKQKVLNPWML
jgi:hypothetical protein